MAVHVGVPEVPRGVQGAAAVVERVRLHAASAIPRVDCSREREGRDVLAHGAFQLLGP